MGDKVVWLSVEDVQAFHDKILWSIEDHNVDLDNDVELVFVTSAAEARAFFAANRGKVKLVFMDVFLEGSDVDGLSLAKELKAENGFDVVIVSTSGGSDEEVQRAREVPAIAWLEKISYSKFAEAMAAVIRVSHERYKLPREFLPYFAFFDESLVGEL